MLTFIFYRQARQNAKVLCGKEKKKLKNSKSRKKIEIRPCLKV